MCKVYRGKLHRTVTLISGQAFGQFIDEAFALVPAQAGVGDRLSVTATVYILPSVFNVAFDHETFYNCADLFAGFAAAQDFPDDPRLLQRVLSGVFVVCRQMKPPSPYR